VCHFVGVINMAERRAFRPTKDIDHFRVDFTRYVASTSQITQDTADLVGMMGSGLGSEVALITGLRFYLLLLEDCVPPFFKTIRGSADPHSTVRCRLKC